VRSLFLTLFATVALLIAFVWWHSLPHPTSVLPVPAGDQEIAWIQPATSTAAWERFVTGVLRLQLLTNLVKVDDSRAFPEATTAVPELLISLSSRKSSLRVRWYKVSKAAGVNDWINRLGDRKPAPLVVIGGGSSDRAYDLAKAMQDQKSWLGEKPVLFFTTATASTVIDPSQALPINLMDVYPGRSFRMCFNNSQIAQAVTDFVWSQPDLRPVGDPTLLLSAVATNSALSAISLLAVHYEHDCPVVSALEWDDDPYSVDLSRQFHEVFHEPRWGHVLVRETRGIPSSIGGQFDPNHWEAEAAEFLISGLSSNPLERQLLVMPTVLAPARRVMRTITAALPFVGRNLVIVTGDSISLNNMYRDADIGWNARELPVPLVAFAHHDPAAWDQPGPEEDRKSAESTNPIESIPRTSAAYLSPPTNTDEVLQHLRMMDEIVSAAWQIDQRDSPGSLTNSSDQMAKRLHSTQYFETNGDRKSGEEYVLCLRPDIVRGNGNSTQVLPTATLEIWYHREGRWLRVKRLTLNYGRNSRDNS